MVATLLYHKSLSWERRTFAFSNDGRKEWATVLFLRAIMHRKAIDVNAIVSFYFSVSAGPRFVEIRNFCTMATWRNDFSLGPKEQNAKINRPITKQDWYFWWATTCNTKTILLLDVVIAQMVIRTTINSNLQCNNIACNLVPRVLSYPPYGTRERETLENAGHVSPRIWEITNLRFGEGTDKCEICPYRA